MHRTASGQDFEQSGSTGLSFGQQGTPSGIDAALEVAAIWSDTIAIADDGTTAGAIKRLKIARIESRRGIGDQIFTPGASHIMYRQGSVDLFTSSLAPRTIGKWFLECDSGMPLSPRTSMRRTVSIRVSPNGRDLRTN